MSKAVLSHARQLISFYNPSYRATDDDVLDKLIIALQRTGIDRFDDDDGGDDTTNGSQSNDQTNNETNGQTKKDSSPRCIHGEVLQAPPDGSCLFHSIGMFVGQSATTIRRQTMAWLRENIDMIYQNMTLASWILAETDETPERYIRRMSNPSEWGGQVELFAISTLYNVNICVVKEREGCRQVTECFAPSDSHETIFVQYDGSTHYNGFVPEDVTKLSVPVLRSRLAPKVSRTTLGTLGKTELQTLYREHYYHV